MKKAFAIILLFLYLVPAIGVTVSAHFCGGKVTSVSIQQSPDGHACPCGSMVMKQNCCKDETSIIKFEDNQQKSPLLQYKSAGRQDGKAAFPGIPLTPFSTLFSIRPSGLVAHPPNAVKQALHIRHCVFRI